MDIREAHLKKLKKQWQQLSLTSSDYHERSLIVDHINHSQSSATWMIAASLKKPTAKVRRVLRSMQADGIVALSEQYTTAGNLVWTLAEPTP
ncbi:hypothetical protein ACQKC8_12565 [Stutzerimonas stutzeri]|uniref:hypothetical protein n=1 Tax=Stutzerimonas stutzeri TaxID=316 RepID=UPI003C2F1B0B